MSVSLVVTAGSSPSCAGFAPKSSLMWAMARLRRRRTWQNRPRPRQQVETAAQRRGRSHRCRRCRSGRPDVAGHVFLEDAPSTARRDPAQVDASSRANRRTEGWRACDRARGQASARHRRRRCRDHCDRRGRWSAHWPAPRSWSPAPRRSRSSGGRPFPWRVPATMLPADTLSPSLTRISLITPARRWYVHRRLVRLRV